MTPNNATRPLAAASLVFALMTGCDQRTATDTDPTAATGPAQEESPKAVGGSLYCVEPKPYTSDSNSSHPDMAKSMVQLLTWEDQAEVKEPTRELALPSPPLSQLEYADVPMCPTIWKGIQTLDPPYLPGTSCSGVVFGDSRHILTAGHCTLNVLAGKPEDRSAYVVLGRTLASTQQQSEPLHERRTLHRVKCIEAYECRTKACGGSDSPDDGVDLMLLELDEPLEDATPLRALERDPDKAELSVFFHPLGLPLMRAHGVHAKLDTKLRLKFDNATGGSGGAIMAGDMLFAIIGGQTDADFSTTTGCFNFTYPTQWQRASRVSKLPTRPAPPIDNIVLKPCSEVNGDTP